MDEIKAALLSGRDYTWQQLVDEFEDADLVDAAIIELRDAGLIWSRSSDAPRAVAIWRRCGS